MIKRLLRRTRLYDFVTRYRARRQAANWTAEDTKLEQLYSTFAAKGDLCFDVGANIGNRVKILLALGCRVVAVEPQKLCVETLKANYGSNPEFSLEEKVLGPSPGEAELRVSSAHTISSLSPEWIDAVSSSGRFSDQSWDRVVTVEMTTLDLLIERYGMPAFIKIDVEGFELEVVRGLSRPVRALSLEFTPEFLDSTFACLDHLSTLGPIETNLSWGESHELHIDRWVGQERLREMLDDVRNETSVFGDVYVRFPS